VIKMKKILSGVSLNTIDAKWSLTASGGIIVLLAVLTLGLLSYNVIKVEQIDQMEVNLRQQVTTITGDIYNPVSYTHLTLPTKRIV